MNGRFLYDLGVARIMLDVYWVLLAGIRVGLFRASAQQYVQHAPRLGRESLPVSPSGILQHLDHPLTNESSCLQSNHCLAFALSSSGLSTSPSILFPLLRAVDGFSW